MFPLFAVILVVGVSPAGWALFTGNDHYDRNKLHTEKNLDSEYFLDLLAYRPFWEPVPGAPEPMAFVRNTEGSLTTNELYVRREAGVRGKVSERGFFGYQLRQLEDLEQQFFYQYFEGQGRIAGPFSVRFFGAPSAQKEDSDIGVGGVFDLGAASVTVHWTWVDFVFNEKTDRHQSDRRNPRNLHAQLMTRAVAGWGVALDFDLDTPLEREFLDDNQLFTYRGSEARLHAVGPPADLELFWRHERRTTGTLATGDVLQDFWKEVYAIHPAWLYRCRDVPGRLGVQVQRRRAEFVNRAAPAETERRQRWEIDPYLTAEVRVASQTTLELGVYSALLWEKRTVASGSSVHDDTFECKLKTAVRFDFSPRAALLLSPTWDLKEFGTRRTFGGGNVQFRAEF